MKQKEWALQLAEASVERNVPLTHAEMRAIAEAGVASIRPTSRAGFYDLQVNNLVGTVRCDTCTVTIRPKLPIAQLMTMIGVSTTGVGVKNDQVELDTEDLSVVIALAFLRQAEGALRGGPLKDYSLRSETATTLRGRLRLADQITLHYDKLVPLEVEYDDLSIDIPENQILLAACRALARVLMGAPTTSTTSALSTEIARDLSKLEWRLRGVTAFTGGTPQWRATRVNRRYHSTLALAELILLHSGTGVSHGNIRTHGLLIDVAAVFENFVAAGAARLRPDLSIRAQRSFSLLIGVAPIRRMTVDILAEQAGTGKRAVLDTKYKKRELSPADIYQLHTYAHVLGLTDAHLIYASPTGESESHQYAVNGTGVTIHQHSLNLKSPIEEVLHQIQTVLDVALPEV